MGSCRVSSAIHACQAWGERNTSCGAHVPAPEAASVPWVPVTHSESHAQQRNMQVFREVRRHNHTCYDTIKEWCDKVAEFTLKDTTAHLHGQRLCRIGLLSHDNTNTRINTDTLSVWSSRESDTCTGSGFCAMGSCETHTHVNHHRTAGILARTTPRKEE